jgi:hypothetical protein
MYRINNRFYKEGTPMPYSIRKRTGPRPWKIIKKSTQEVVGTSISKAKAEASVRARHWGEHRKG